MTEQYMTIRVKKHTYERFAHLIRRFGDEPEWALELILLTAIEEIEKGGHPYTL
jgi:hypothetical protein